MRISISYRTFSFWRSFGFSHMRKSQTKKPLAGLNLKNERDLFFKF